MMRSIRALLPSACMAIMGLNPAPAYAYLCYIGDSPEGSVPLHARPDPSATVLLRLTQFDMVDIIRDSRKREGWSLIRIWKDGATDTAPEGGKRREKGWMLRAHIRGECED